jgi:hypothetical protein
MVLPLCCCPNDRRQGEVPLLAMLLAGREIAYNVFAVIPACAGMTIRGKLDAKMDTAHHFTPAMAAAR